MKLVLVAGARPNFMKLAPILEALRSRNASATSEPVQAIVVHTGQHYDYEMSDVFFQELGIPEPDVCLGVGSGTHAEQTGHSMVGLERVLFQEKPDVVVVVGDVNATLAGALAAAKLHIPVAHVEAGVRSFDKSMPEEINRVLTDHVSEYLFTASLQDDDNLLREGIGAAKVHRVGNIIADTLLANRDVALKSDVLGQLGLSKGAFALVTLHRPGNVDSRRRLEPILAGLASLGNHIPVVFPVHPRTRKRIHEFGLEHLCDGLTRGVVLTDPQGYLSFLNLEMNSLMVITDSGGVQVETTVLGVPCLTVLDKPVWPITHEEGTNVLVGCDGQRLVEEALKVLSGEARKGSVPELWDGKTAERIVAVLLHGSN